jgi:hypothetical protein
MPDRLIIEMVYCCNFWLNSFPPLNGISTSLRPRAIITCGTIDFRHHCQLEFGLYVQTHEEHDNSMDARTIGALALWPTGNAQGGYYFFSLTSGRVLHRNKWTELPMPNDVIIRIHALAWRNHHGLIFLNRDTLPFVLDPDYDDDANDDDSTFYPDHNDDDATAGVDNDDDDDNIIANNKNTDDDNNDENPEIDNIEDNKEEHGNRAT